MGEIIALAGSLAEVYTPPIIPVSALHQERWTSARFGRWLGGVAVQGALAESVAAQPETVPPEETPPVSLHESIRRIQTGEHSAEDVAMAKENIRTTVSETLYKAGNITSVTAHFDGHGNLGQHNQSYDSIYRNTLEKSPLSELMQRRTKIEALNWHRLEDLARSGTLKDHYMVVFSLAPQTAEEVTENGFFDATLSLSIQANTMELTQGEADTDEWRLKTTTAFVAGMEPWQDDTNLTKEERLQRLDWAMQRRFDLPAVRELYKKWGVADADKMSEEDLLATPLCIPKQQMPNGVSDIAKAYDAATGKGTFFGSPDIPKQDYNTFENYCAGREQQLDEIVEKVLQELIQKNQASANIFETNKLMGKIVLAHTFVKAVKDDSIDTRIFGIRSEQYLLAARGAWQAGDTAAFAISVLAGMNVAVSLVCNIVSKGSAGDSVLDSLSKALGMSREMLDDPEDRSNWEWHRGKCRIESCEYSKKETWIGPCEVCEHCQDIYDKGGDPTKR